MKWLEPRSRGRRRFALMAWLAAAAVMFALTGPTTEASAATQPPAGWYTIHNHYGLCLDMTNGSTALNTQAQLWTCNGKAQQLWYVYPVDGTHWLIQNNNSGLCLSLLGTTPSLGDAVTQYNCNYSGGDAYEDWNNDGFNHIQNYGLSTGYMHPSGNQSYNGVKIYVNGPPKYLAYQWSFCPYGGGSCIL
jgi:Ricin-type beta-trefoil lectin domain-like